MENVPSSKNYFQANSRSVIIKHWNNTRVICLNIFLQTPDMFLHTRLTELHIFFVTISTAFFSSTAIQSLKNDLWVDELHFQ